MANQIVWVDIPVAQLDRAIRFYSAVLGRSVRREEMPGLTMGVLPHEEGEVGGCLFRSDKTRPSDQGVLVYLNCQGRLDAAIAAVEQNGGKVLQGKHAIEPYGWKAIVQDSEGNRVALHSN